MTDSPLTIDQQRLWDQLRLHEGQRLKPYVDSVGKVTIGVGRNLTDVGISKDESHFLWRTDVIHAEDGLDKDITWWRNLDGIRQRVLLDMTFNMGIGGILAFHNTLEMVRTGNYAGAADAMLQSKWASQVHARAQRLAEMMRTGKDYTS